MSIEDLITNAIKEGFDGLSLEQTAAIAIHTGDDTMPLITDYTTLSPARIKQFFMPDIQTESIKQLPLPWFPYRNTQGVLYKNFKAYLDEIVEQQKDALEGTSLLAGLTNYADLI